MATKTFNTGDVLTAADVQGYLNVGKVWSTYTPSVTAVTTPPTLGSGSTASGRYITLGAWTFVVIFIKFGTSGTAAGSGFYSVSLPVAAGASALSTTFSGRLLDNSSGTHMPCVGVCDGAGASTITRIRWPNGAAAGTTSSSVNDAVPWTWAASDELAFTGSYESA